jgi:hypothetical protein
MTRFLSKLDFFFKKKEKMICDVLGKKTLVEVKRHLLKQKTPF